MDQFKLTQQWSLTVQDHIHFVKAGVVLAHAHKGQWQCFGQTHGLAGRQLKGLELAPLARVWLLALTWCTRSAYGFF